METEATKLGRTAIVETRKSVNEPDTSGARQDVRLWGFLIILMMIAITSTVGLETRFLIDRGNSGYAIVLVAVFFAVTLGLAVFQTVRALNSGTVVLKGRRGRQPVLEAPEELANAVRDRSAALGLQNVLDIGYLPRTWNLVDAYVAGIGRHQTIVLTGGMMQLFYSSVPERQAQFRFVIDHELGHVAHGDTTVLYLASAAISVFSLALPIKLVLLWWLGLDGMVGLYDSAFPRVFDQSVIFGFLTGPGPNLLMELTAQRPAPAIALSFLLGFFLLMLTVQTCLYVMIVRRREFMADAFAKAVSRDTRNVDRALRDLLSTTGLQQGPRQGFKGGIRWHPKPLERLNAAVDKAQGMLNDWAVALLLVTAIFAFRIAFGASAVDIMRSVSPALEPVSGVFLLLTGFIVSALLDRRHAPDAVGLWLRAFFLSLWSALFAGAIAGLVALGQQPPWFFDFGLNENFANMMRLERLDWTLTILSIPFVILVLALVNVGLQHVMKDRPERFESRLGVSISDHSNRIGAAGS